jgi:hypothetical protein
MPELLIRPYQPKDRESVFRIAADTAFFGAPIEAYMEDRNVFLDAFYAYYIDLEPEHAWVACSEVVWMRVCMEGNSSVSSCHGLSVIYCEESTGLESGVMDTWRV